MGCVRREIEFQTGWARFFWGPIGLVTEKCQWNHLEHVPTFFGDFEQFLDWQLKKKDLKHNLFQPNFHRLHSPWLDCLILSTVIEVTEHTGPTYFHSVFIWASFFKKRHSQQEAGCVCTLGLASYHGSQSSAVLYRHGPWRALQHVEQSKLNVFAINFSRGSECHILVNHSKAIMTSSRMSILYWSCNVYLAYPTYAVPLDGWDARSS